MRTSRWKCRKACYSLSIALGLATAWQGQVLAAQQSQAAAETTELLVQVDINGQGLDETVLVLRDRAGNFFLSDGDLQRWHLNLPPCDSLVDQGTKYLPLAAVPGVQTRFDESRLALTILAPTSVFPTSNVDAASQEKPQPKITGTGAFMNYDVLADRTDGVTVTNGLAELGYFDRLGVGTASFLGVSGGDTDDFIRLETTWTHDFPASRRTLRIGDSFTRPGVWGRGIRFGGIQFGTNFAVDPSFSSLPLQSVAGEAVLPSSVDIYVNNALTSRSDLPPGPFFINNVPVVTGHGEVRVVVRDILGREQIITQPFFAASNLLRAGLSDYSVEVGNVRENFALNSNDYGRSLAVGTYRRGLSDQFTGEVRALVARGDKALGLAGSFLVGHIGVVNGTVAASHSGRGTGSLYQLGFDGQISSLTYGVHATQADDRFVQIGDEASTQRRLTSANVGYLFDRGDSIGAGYVKQENFDGSSVRVASLNYSARVGTVGLLGISLLRATSDVTTNSFNVAFTVPLGDSTSGSLTARGSSSPAAKDDEVVAQLQHSVPRGPGLGYFMQASNRDTGQAGLFAQSAVGAYSLEAARFEGTESVRAGTSGGMAFIGNRLFLSRRVDESFAVVRLPGFAKVRVTADNQEVARTDQRGDAIITRLRPYDDNRLGIEQLDLPLDTEIGALTLSAVPYYRSGLLVQFPVRHIRAATLHILLPDGSPLPMQAVVHVNNDAESFPVGMGGELYLRNLEQDNRVRVNIDGRRCEIKFTYPITTDPQPDLGTFECKASGL